MEVVLEGLGKVRRFGVGEVVREGLRREVVVEMFD